MSIFDPGACTGVTAAQELPASHFYRDRCRRRLVATGAVPSFEQIADHEYLLAVYEGLKREGGPAPGPDGLTYSDLGRREAAALMRRLSHLLRSGGYQPGPARQVRRPKPAGGYRTLSLRSIIDRVVSAALNEALSPYWDRLFLPMVMGCRPGRGVHRMLAEMEFIMERDDRWVLAIDDIRGAFDHVNIDALMDDHRQHIQDGRLLNLIETVLRGPERRNIGIDQGGAYSPTCLNLRLHYALDAVYHQYSMNPPGYRYVDNLVYLCRSVPEGHQTLHQVQHLLNLVGLQLKGINGPPANLQQGQTAEMLGFLMTQQGGQLQYNLGPMAWVKLEESLGDAYGTTYPASTAINAVKGWIGAYGPAYESLGDDHRDGLLQTQARYGFRETFLEDQIWSWWRTSYRAWRSYRQSVRRALLQDGNLGG